MCFCSSPKMWGFWLHRQKQEAGGEGPASIIHATRVCTIHIIIAEHVGLLVTQAEARSWRGGTSFTCCMREHCNIITMTCAKHDYTTRFTNAETNVGLLFFHRQKHEAGGEGPVSHAA